MTIETPGLVAGVWAIDPVHSEVSFTVRHLMVSKVRGTFNKFDGKISVGDDPLQSSIEAHIEAASIDTRNPDRDTHVRSADFLDTETYPSIDFVSTAIRTVGSDVFLDGNVTIHGVTKPVSLELEFNGVGPDPYGGTRLGVSASGEINRKDFGVDMHAALEGGGVVLSDKIAVTIEIEAVLS